MLEKYKKLEKGEELDMLSNKSILHLFSASFPIYLPHFLHQMRQIN